MTPVETCTRYIQEIAAFTTDPAVFARYVHPEMRQTEFPNGLNPQGQESDLADSLRRAEHGRKLLAGQRFEVTNAFEQGDRVVVEALWTGELQDGRAMRAHSCMVFELRDGKIYRQRNYDCFAPIGSL